MLITREMVEAPGWPPIRASSPRPKRGSIQDLRDGKSYVYFVGGDVGCIKIGTSIAPQERLKTLTNNSPVPLRIMAMIEGDRQVEKIYHDRFASHRRHGEWFDRAPELLAEIEELAA